VIDALLGTGFAGALRGVIRELCHVINMKHKKPVLAVDIPTGVNADDGSADEDAISADVTVTMALPKPGLYLYPGRKHSGPH
jgi:NAD(P)H-hydrate epimerase